MLYQPCTHHASAGAEPTRHGPAGAAIEAWARRGGAIEALQTANTTSRVATRTHKLTACIHSVRRTHISVCYTHTQAHYVKNQCASSHIISVLHAHASTQRVQSKCVARTSHVCTIHTLTSAQRAQPTLREHHLCAIRTHALIAVHSVHNQSAPRAHPMCVLHALTVRIVYIQRVYSHLITICVLRSVHN